MKRKVRVDKNKVKALFTLAMTTHERLHSYNTLKYPSHTLDDYYDILHALMEAVSCIKGIKFQRDSAHKELINFVAAELQFSSADQAFLQHIRHLRNRIAYEGLFIQSEFIERNIDMFELLIVKLRKFVVGELG